MPNQSPGRGKIKFKDGAKVSVKAKGAGSYTDLGTILTSVNGVINYDEDQVETANRGKLSKRIKNMTMAVDFTLGDIDPDTMVMLSGGAMTKGSIAGTIISTLADQVVPADSAELENINLVVANNNPGDEANLKVSSALIIASVTYDALGTPVVLAENDDYTIVNDTNSQSGKSIVFNTAGTLLPDMTKDITIVYTSVIPVERTELYMGSSSFILQGYALKVTYTDTNGKTREWEATNVNTNSGGFALNFGGANEDGIDELPLSITADIDTALMDTKQLFTYREDAGLVGE